MEQVTAGVDCQDDRLVAVVMGFAPGNLELWVLDHADVLGDPRERAVWQQLDALLMVSTPPRSRRRRRPVSHPPYRQATPCGRGPPLFCTNSVRRQRWCLFVGREQAHSHLPRQR